jgi:hypothetical protein
VLQPRRQQLTSSLPGEPQTSSTEVFENKMFRKIFVLCVSGSEYSASNFMIYISLTSKEHDIHTSGLARKCKEHMRHICPAQPEKSALVEHIFQIGHNIYFGSIYILHKATGYMDHVTK